MGASETIGLIGGVRNSQLAAYSEAVERAVGDVLTMTICDILSSASPDTRILLLGPAFPKLIGRICSLHPPSFVQFGWILPQSAAWVLGGYDRFPSMRESQLAQQLTEESLIATTEIYDRLSGSYLTLQNLCMWVPAAFELSDFHFSREKCVPLGCSLPRELAVATGQAENHVKLNYEGTPEEILRPLPVGFPRDEYEPAANYRSSRATFRPADLGWEIKWVLK